MSVETFELLLKMDDKDIETQMALQCAPLITGIKMSNLLNIHKSEYHKMKQIIKNSSICEYMFLNSENMVTVLLYKRDELENYLRQENVIKLLKKEGYDDLRLHKVLKVFKKRYEDYMQNPGEFPHEMGVLLGYPVEDITGFMENKGKNSIYTGYWKVYENKEEKIKEFKKFDNAKENLILLLSYGMSMIDIIDICSHSNKILATG